MLICGNRVGSSASIVLVLVFMASLATHYRRRSTVQYVMHRDGDPSEFPNRPCGGRLTKATITRLQDNCSLVTAPYFDNRRSPLIRVISIVHYEKVKELHCLFCCANSSSSSIITARAKIDVHSDRFGFPYGTADLVCAEPQSCRPQYMSVHPSPAEADLAQLPMFEIQNRNGGSSLRDFTVCISSMFGEYNNVLQFIQSMEMYKILGAPKVTIYKNNCSPLMEKVLEYYGSQGMTEIVPWPIHLYLSPSSHWHHSLDAKDIGYYGQIATLNDCIYRNMYKSRYVLLNDMDEIILPTQDADWASLMRRLEKQHPEAGVFLFENHIFPNTVFASSAGEFSFASWDALPGVNILAHVYKEPNKKDDFNNRKMIVDPRKVIQTSVHSVLKMYGTPVEVSSDIAFNFHCRIPYRTDITEESLIRDTTLWRYNTSLITNTNRVLRNANISAAKTQP